MALAPGPENRLGFLHNCLVEGDTDREGRVRRGKQRALLISIVFQILIVAALILFPLLTRSERITVRGDFTPVPPYNRGSASNHRTTVSHAPGGKPQACRFCVPLAIPPTIAFHDTGPTGDPDVPVGPEIPGLPTGPSVPGGLTPPDSHLGPTPPPARTPMV